MYPFFYPYERNVWKKILLHIWKNMTARCNYKVTFVWIFLCAKVENVIECWRSWDTRRPMRFNIKDVATANNIWMFKFARALRWIGCLFLTQSKRLALETLQCKYIFYDCSIAYLYLVMCFIFKKVDRWMRWDQRPVCLCDIWYKAYLIKLVISWLFEEFCRVDAVGLGAQK